MRDKKPRKILHIDLDSFFCAVEILFDPSLKNKPVAVGGSPQGRGVVASCSYAARKFGVHSAMPMAQALRLCPGLIVRSHRFREYSLISKEVMAEFYTYTPLVEPVSIDEAFIDVTDLEGTCHEIAREIQQRINQKHRLPCSIGGGTNKLIAKIATNVGKSSRGQDDDEPPNAIMIVPPGFETEFLSPLPVQALWGVGPKTAKQMEALGIVKIGDLAGTPVRVLVERFGEYGREFLRRAQGVDDGKIITSRVIKSVSQERTFAHDISDQSVLLDHLRKLSKGVEYRLKKTGKIAKTVKVKIRWSDFTTLTRQAALNQPSNTAANIYPVAQKLFVSNWNPGMPVRLIGVGVCGLLESAHQLSLWDEKTKKEVNLEKALASIRDQFGDHIVHWGMDD